MTCCSLVLCLALLTNAPGDTTSLFQAERAFAAHAAVHGMDAAFLTYLAPDGILFRGGPVNAHAWIRDHPTPGSVRLVWEPSAGVVSAGGDLGLTTGPWTIRDTARTDRPSRYGHFVSVWKRQGDGNWRVAVDIGIGHPEPSRDAVRGHAFMPAKAVPGPGGDMGAASAALMKAEEEIVIAMDRAGTRTPFLDAIAPEAVLYRSGRAPVTDGAVMRKIIGETMQPYHWRPVAAFVASSGDLACSYGSYVAGNERGSYVRVWRRAGPGGWRMIVEVTDPDL